MTPTPTPTPTPTLKDLKSHSPTLTKLLKARPAPVRETALISAATSHAKPVRPAAGDCCGSSCDPCVLELFAQELRVWKECREVRGEVEVDVDVDVDGRDVEEVDGKEKGGEVGLKDQVDVYKVPGAYEW